MFSVAAFQLHLFMPQLRELHFHVVQVNGLCIGIACYQGLAAILHFLLQVLLQLGIFHFQLLDFDNRYLVFLLYGVILLDANVHFCL